MQSDLSTDLKAATYEYQLSRQDEKELEPIRQTALCLEDILRTVTGQLDQYPYTKKRVVKSGTTGLEGGRSRAASLAALKNRHSQLSSVVMIKQRVAPGERQSKLT